MNKLLFTLPTLSMQSSKMPRIFEICKRLDRRIFKPLVSVDHTGRLNRETQTLLQNIDVPVEILRMSPHRSALIVSSFSLLTTIKQIRKMDIAIQHSSDYSMGWSEAIVAKLGGVRHWITTKTNSDLSSFNWFLKFYLADKIIVQSPIMKDKLIKKYPFFKYKITVIPNGVDLDIFHPKSINKDLRTILNIPENSLVLGCVADLLPVKNHLELIEALSKSVTRKQIILLLIGKQYQGNYFYEIKKRIADKGIEDQVICLGERKDVADLCSCMDGLILTSKKESLSNAVLQGMACGLPIICSNVGGMADVVLPGKNGWIINLGENYQNELTFAIDDWASNPQKRQMYGEESIKIIQKSYTVENMVQKHIQLYESLIE